MTEFEFLTGLKDYLEYEEQTDLLQLLSDVEIHFDKTSAFTSKSWQFKEYIDIRVPIKRMKQVEYYEKTLDRACAKIYIETTDYDYAGLFIKPLTRKAIQVEDTSVGTSKVVENEKQVYFNLKEKVLSKNIDELEKVYLLEACSCAINDNNLAAATMIGCAAEQLLLLLSKAFLTYLQNNGASETELQNYTRSVVNADKAHKRLDGFYKYVQNREKLFEGLGFEKSTLHFSFLDIVRQVRNN